MRFRALRSAAQEGSLLKFDDPRLTIYIRVFYIDHLRTVRKTRVNSKGCAIYHVGCDFVIGPHGVRIM